MNPYRRLMKLARRQHGLVTRAQALDSGLARWDIERLLAGGQWSKVRRGVYCIAGTPPSWEQTVRAATLAAASGVASHLTSGRLHGLRTPRPEGIDLLTEPSGRIRLPGVVHHRTDLLPRSDLTVVRGIPATTAARTLCDVGGMFTVRTLGITVNDALRRGTVRLERLRAAHDRLAAGSGRRPHRTMAAVLAQRAPGFDPGDSEAEMRTLHTLVRAGFPRPEQQYPVRIGTRLFYLDLAYPDLKGCIEYDGVDAHGHDEAFHADRGRWRLLTAAGWRIIPVTSRTTDAELIEAVAALFELGGRSASA